MFCPQQEMLSDALMSLRAPQELLMPGPSRTQGTRVWGPKQAGFSSQLLRQSTARLTQVPEAGQTCLD